MGHSEPETPDRPKTPEALESREQPLPAPVFPFFPHFPPAPGLIPPPIGHPLFPRFPLTLGKNLPHPAMPNLPMPPPLFMQPRTEDISEPKDKPVVEKPASVVISASPLALKTEKSEKPQPLPIPTLKEKSGEKVSCVQYVTLLNHTWYIKQSPIIGSVFFSLLNRDTVADVKVCKTNACGLDFVIYAIKY
jgi:hypothetical protein